MCQAVPGTGEQGRKSPRLMVHTVANRWKMRSRSHHSDIAILCKHSVRLPVEKWTFGLGAANV